MSGGSYNYLCYVEDLEDLIGKRHSLQEMADSLGELDYAADAARETEELLAIIRQWEVRAGVRIDRLKDVWKALEWWHSSDSGEDGLREALAAYRGEPGQPEHDPDPKAAV